MLVLTIDISEIYRSILTQITLDEIKIRKRHIYIIYNPLITISVNFTFIKKMF